MSGIAVVLSLDGAPADRALLARMVNAMAHRGPDGLKLLTAGPVALGHAMFVTTPEAKRERQPLADPDAGLILTLDGRVDNRKELRTAIEDRGGRLRDDTDAELVLRAYQRFGEDCAAKMIGDFAFAIWDSRRQHLFCARDPLGVRPFYYFFDRHRFVAASELQQIFEYPGFPCEPNEGFAGEILSDSLTARDETLFRDVMRLVGSHCLTVSAKDVKTRRYYDLDSHNPIRYRTDGEYAEHFGELFFEAVRCRMRSNDGVAAELSGGLDSSSVVGAAQSFILKGTVSPDRFALFSMRFSRPECDETGYIDEVARFWNLPVNYSDPFLPDADFCREQVIQSWDFPDYVNGSMQQNMRREISRQGFRAALTGFGSDQWFGGSWLYCADLILRLRVLEALRQCHIGPRSISLPTTRAILPSLQIFANYAIAPIVSKWIPERAKRRIRKLIGREPYPSFVARDFADRTGLLDRLRPARQMNCATFAQQDTYDVFNAADVALALEMDDRACSRLCLEKRHPFCDRRIVEFAISVPETVLRRDGETKFVQRQAMRGLLPKIVTQRQSKAEFSYVVPTAMEANGGATIFDRLRIAELGWIDSAAARAVYEQMIRRYRLNDDNYMVDMRGLWTIFALEVWLSQTLEAKRQSLAS